MAQRTEKTIPNPVQVQKFLGGIDYPADKKTLMEKAREKGADDKVMNALNQLAEKRYNSANDVSEEIGKLT